MHWFNNFCPGCGSQGGWIIMMIIFWLPLILLFLWLFRSWDKTMPKNEKEDSLDVLKKRYARGEIDKNEFEEKKKDLS